MNKYVLKVEWGNEAVITKNGEIFWQVKIETNISGFGFSAKSSTGESFRLESKGLFWWRKLTLLQEAKAIESFELTKALSNNITLDSRNFIYRNGEYQFSLDIAEPDIEGEGARLTWKTEQESIAPFVFTLSLIHISEPTRPY